MVSLLLGASAEAASRVALVIGNAGYRNEAALPDPGSDARDIGDALRRLGFSVTRARDASYDDMRRALLQFGASGGGGGGRGGATRERCIGGDRSACQALCDMGRDRACNKLRRLSR